MSSKFSHVLIDYLLTQNGMISRWTSQKDFELTLSSLSTPEDVGASAFRDGLTGSWCLSRTWVFYPITPPPSFVNHWYRIGSVSVPGIV